MDMLDQRVESLCAGSLFLNSLPGDSDSDSVREIAHSLAPDELVELGVDADVLSVHHLLDQLFDFVDRAGSFALKLGAMSEFVDVDGRVNGDF